jgi:membrane fusion protein (multidrug efflux system)
VRARRWTEAHPRGAIGLIVALALFIAAVLLLSRYLQSYESTDDAQVDGHVSPVGARIAGTVQTVYVDENQPVKKGELLVELDPRDYKVALDRAEADLAQAEANLHVEDPRVHITRVTQETQVTTSAQDVDAARAQLAAAERDREAAQARVRQALANADRARADIERYQYLLREKAIPKERFDLVKATKRASDAEVASQRALAKASDKVVTQQQERLQEAIARKEQIQSNAPSEVKSQGASVTARQAAVQAAQAIVEQARLNLAYTRIVAPFDGRIGRRSVQPGEHVSAGQALLAVVDSGNLWVTANFKETQLRRMRPGQPARIHVDAYAAELDGYVETLGAASGALYSLLPPENATGNYVKVVQRVPVRIRFKPVQPLVSKLVPGLSVEPKVWMK